MVSQFRLFAPIDFQLIKPWFFFGGGNPLVGIVPTEQIFTSNRIICDVSEL